MELSTDLLALHLAEIDGAAEHARPDRSARRRLVSACAGSVGGLTAMVNGYGREEYAHLAVAAAVQSGAADCGLGVRTAAGALGLGFVPVDWERYDLVIPREFYDCDLLGPLLELLRDSEDFRRAVAELEGYDPTPMGEIVAAGG